MHKRLHKHGHLKTLLRLQQPRLSFSCATYNFIHGFISASPEGRGKLSSLEYFQAQKYKTRIASTKWWNFRLDSNKCCVLPELESLPSPAAIIHEFGVHYSYILRFCLVSPFMETAVVIVDEEFRVRSKGDLFVRQSHVDCQRC